MNAKNDYKSERKSDCKNECKKVSINSEYIFAFVSVFAWGTMAPISKVLLDGYTNMEVLGYGSAIGALMLLLVLICRGELKQFKEYGIRSIIKLILLGFTGYFLYSASYYEGLKRLSSQTACVLNYLWPIVSVIVSSIVLKERLNKAMAAAIALSFAGVIVMMFPEMRQGGSMKGYLFCILGALLYGSFNVLNKKQGGSQTLNMFVYLSVGAIGALLANIPNGFQIPKGFDILGFLWLGVVIDGLGYLLWAMAMQGKATGIISNFAYATPVISLVLSATFLKERIAVNMFIGMLMILAGIGLQVYRNIRKA